MSSKFVFEWEIPWKIFETLSEKNPDYYSDTFITCRNGVAYKWRVDIQVTFSEQEGHLGLFLHFMDGCTDAVDAVVCKFEILNGGSPVKTKKSEERSYHYQHNTDWGYSKFEPFSKEELQDKYKLETSKPFTMRFKLIIPHKAFEYRAEFPVVDVAPKWLVQQYENIDKPPSAEDGILSDIQIESNDGVIFYVQKNVLQSQSKPLRVIIQRDGTESNSSVQFPALDSDALRTLLRFLYVGLLDTADLSTDVVIQLLDAAEQYELPILKEICNAALWTRVNDKCTDAPVIMKAADTYKLNGLKMHAISVLVENFGDIQAAVDVFNILTKELYQDITIYVVSRGRCRMIS